jgi:hypothetical protein
MPPRVINLLINPLVWLWPPKNLQKGALQWGDAHPPGLEGGFPTWAYAEFILNPYRTSRTTLRLPAGFTLLSYFAGSFLPPSGGVMLAKKAGKTDPPGPPGDFAVSVYDVNRRISLTTRPIDASIIAGPGGAPFYQRAPYSFVTENAQVKITVINRSNAVNTIQFILFGVQGGSPA